MLLENIIIKRHVLNGCTSNRNGTDRIGHRTIEIVESFDRDITDRHTITNEFPRFIVHLFACVSHIVLSLIRADTAYRIAKLDKTRLDMLAKFRVWLGYLHGRLPRRHFIQR